MDTILRWIGVKIIGTAEITLSGKTVRIAFILMPYLSKRYINLKGSDDKEYSQHQEYQDFIVEDLNKSIELAYDTNIQILGLGGFNSVISKDGTTLRNNPLVKNNNIAITSGNSLTTGAVYRAIGKACGELGIESSKSNICIFGATGSIGGALTELVAADFEKVFIISNTESELQRMKKNLSSTNDNVIVAINNRSEAVRNSDVVIITTSATDFRELGFCLDDVQEGTLWLDVGRPRITFENIVSDRPGILAIEGGIYNFPGKMDPSTILGMDKEDKTDDEPSNVFACFLETVLLCLEGRRENFSMGKSKIGKVREILRICDKWGFELSWYRMFDRPISPGRVEFVREVREKIK